MRKQQKRRFGEAPFRRISTVCVLMVLAGLPTRADDGPKIKLFTGHVPPYVAPVGNGTETVSMQIEGILAAEVFAFLEEKQVAVEVQMLPWSAAYRRTLETPNSLVFPLDRIPEREGKFIWLKTLHTNEYYLYGQADLADPKVTLAEIAASGGQVSCTRNSVQCELLAAGGLQEENILRVEGASVSDRYRMMMRARNQYSIFDPNVFEFLTKKHGLDPDRLVRLQMVGERVSYLAANQNIAKELLDKLR